MPEPIYDATLDRVDSDQVWELTRDTGKHPRREFRFGAIVATGIPSEGAARCHELTTRQRPSVAAR